MNTGEWPVASRGSYNVYEGFLNGSKVCVKQSWVYSGGESEMAKNVRFQLQRIYPLVPDERQAFFQEAVLWKHLEHPNIVPLLGATDTPPTGFGLDGWRRAIEIHCHPPVHRPAQSRRFSQRYIEQRTYSLAKFLMLLMVSAISIPVMSSTGISRGLVMFRRVSQTY